MSPNVRVSGTLQVAALTSLNLTIDLSKEHPSALLQLLVLFQQLFVDRSESSAMSACSNIYQLDHSGHGQWDDLHPGLKCSTSL